MAQSKGHLSDRRAETVIRVAWTAPDSALYGRYEPEPIAEGTGLEGDLHLPLALPLVALLSNDSS